MERSARTGAGWSAALILITRRAGTKTPCWRRLRLRYRGGSVCESMLPLLPTRRRPRCRSTSCLLCIGLVALYHSLLAGLLMHFWVASSAGLQHENLELAGRVSELSGRVAALQLSAERQLQERSVDSLQVAPKPARKPAPAPKAVLPASAAPTDRCGREESGPPPPDPKASSESVILVGERTRITLLSMATLRLEHLVRVRVRVRARARARG